MSNSQHLSSTGEWYSPESEVGLGRKALGGEIYLDPCSSAKANTIVKAQYFFTYKDQSLDRPWLPCEDLTIWENPPGTCPKDILGFTVCRNKKGCSCKLPQRFLEKTVSECAANRGSAVFLAYSVNLLRHLSRMILPQSLICTIAVPPKRIHYLNSDTMMPVRQTNCDSVFFHFTTRESTLFVNTFSEAGYAVYRRH